jgi:hypothetical protein
VISQLFAFQMGSCDCTGSLKKAEVKAPAAGFDLRAYSTQVTGSLTSVDCFQARDSTSLGKASPPGLSMSSHGLPLISLSRRYQPGSFSDYYASKHRRLLWLAGFLPKAMPRLSIRRSNLHA